MVLAALSLALIALGVLGRGHPARAETAAGRVSNRRRGLLVVAFGLWVWLLPVVGFAVTSFAAFLALMAIGEHDRVGARTWLIRAAVAVAIVAGFWWLMADVLLLRMPRGLLF